MCCWAPVRPSVHPGRDQEVELSEAGRVGNAVVCPVSQGEVTHPWAPAGSGGIGGQSGSVCSGAHGISNQATGQPVSPLAGTAVPTDTGPGSQVPWKSLPTSELVLLKCLFHFQLHYAQSTGRRWQTGPDDPVVAFSKRVPPTHHHPPSESPAGRCRLLRRAACPPTPAVTGGVPVGFLP